MNKVYMNKLCVMFFLILLCGSCKYKEKTGDDASTSQPDISISDVYVDTMRLKSKTFNRQLICNGKLEAIESSDLAFENNGIVTRIFVCNGGHVRAGQLVAQTDKTDCMLDVAKAQKDLARARVDLSDKLIGLGYDGISAKVPAGVMRRAKVTCGYFSAVYALQEAREHLKKCSLYAPYSGRISNLTTSRYQHVDKLCTLIKDGVMDVSFSVLEAELRNIHKGQVVYVSPLSDTNKRYIGRVTEINPSVDENGLVIVKARLANSSNRLLTGMNVKVVIDSNVGRVLVVPKDAVVDRDGYHVIFEYQNGEAVWTYVDIAYSNMDSYAITGCKEKETEIHEGDVVITSGNINLADGTKVKIRKK